MGNVEKRGPNTWRVGVQLNDQPGRPWIRRKVKYPPTMSEAQQRKAAEKELAKLVVDVDSGKVKVTQSMTVAAMAELWMTQHVIPNCKPTTTKTYRNLLDKRILPALGDMPLDKLKPLKITEFLSDLHKETCTTQALPLEKRKRSVSPSDEAKKSKNPEKTISDKTVRHHYDVLNYMLNKAVQWDLLTVNPMEKVDRPRARRARMKWLSDEQAVQLLRCLAQDERIPFRAAVLLGLLCGLRLGEVGGLYLSDVDWNNNSIEIQRGLNYTPDKGNYLDLPKSEAGIRLISLPEGMMELLLATKQYHEETAAQIGDRWHGDGRIICSWDGGPLHHDTPSKWFRAFADKNGFDGVTFQQLRHTHASLLFANNMDAVAVASRLGHSDPSVTFRNYAHAYRARDKQSAAAMQSLLDRADSD